MSNPNPSLPPAAKAIFAKAIRNSPVTGTKTIVDYGPKSIPVHNSGARRPNFPSGGGV